MKLTIREMRYLYEEGGSNSWEKYSIKNKLRDVYNSLSILSDSEKLHEFIPELLPLIRVVMKIAFLIDANSIISEIKKDTNGES